MKARELQTIRNTLNITQAEFALELGLSIKTVQAWEQGWRHIPHNTARLIRILSEHRSFRFLYPPE